MKKKWMNLFIVAIIAVMAISFTGCSSNNDQAKDSGKQTDTAAIQTDVTSAVLVAENKLQIIFEADKDTGLLVAKSRYKTLDDVKTFLKGYYTDAMAQKLVDSYVKMEKVGDTEAPVLSLPEDYIALTNQKPEVKVENDKATVTFTENNKTVTYGLVKQNDKWLVDSKDVK